MPSARACGHSTTVEGRWLLVGIGRTAALLVAFLLAFYATTFAVSVGDRPTCKRDGSVVTCLRVAALDLAEQFKVADEQFRVALVKALEASGMFSRVTSTGRGDYQLLAHIVAQQSQRAGFLTVTASFVANYRLREEESGREVWRETIVTHETAEGRPVSEGVPGAGKKALAAAVRRNIADMLEKLARNVQ